MPLPHGTLAELAAGPQRVDAATRLALAGRIVDWLKAEHGNRLIAIAVYGSVALNADGPFSDIEIWAAIKDGDEDIDLSHEWVWGPGKAEVNVMSETALTNYAAEFDELWPMTHGQFAHARPLYEAPGREGFVEEIRQLALSFSDGDRDAALAEAIVGNVYEDIGKLRNAAALGRTGPVPRLACELADQAACFAALARRHSFRSGSTLIQEAQAFDGPDGQAELLALVGSGDLRDPAAVTAVAERYWAGLCAWAQARGLDLTTRCVP